MRPATSCAHSYVVGHAATALERRRAIASRRRGTSRTCPGSAGPSWNARSAAATRSSVVRLAHALQRRSRARDEARHEPALGLDELDDLRPDTRARRRPASRPARRFGRCRGGPCPSPRRGARRRSPSTSTLRLWFVIPPPSTSTRALTTRPDAFDGSVESAHARIRSPLGIEQRLVGDDAGHPLAEDLDRDLGADAVLRQAGTRTRSTSRPCSRSRRSSRGPPSRSPTRTGSEPRAIARGSSSVRQRSTPLGLGARRRVRRGRRSRPCRASPRSRAPPRTACPPA